MKKNPLVSVIIPSHNRPDRVLCAVKSVFEQTYKNFEIIIVDDCSNIEVACLIPKKFNKKVTCYRHKINRGASAARNTGIANAKGEWIAFLDDDDQWLPQKLEKQIEAMQGNRQDLAFITCWYRLWSNGELVAEKCPRCSANLKMEMLDANVIGGTPMALVRKDCFEVVGGFDECLPACQDWDMWLRILEKYTALVIPEFLVDCHAHGPQISTKIDRRIAGRERFLEKHYKKISLYPNALAQHFRRIGCLNFAASHKQKALHFFLKAIKSKILSLNSWICLLIFLLFPPKYALRFLTRYAVTNIGGVFYYH